jgi:hypothetical protein
MDFTVTQRFPAPTDDVLALYTDPEFFVSLPPSEKLATPELVTHQRNGNSVNLQLRYRFIGQLPSAVLRFVEPTRLTWVEDTTIDVMSASSSSALIPDNYPDLLRASASATFASTSSGVSTGTSNGAGGGPSTTRTITGRVSVPVPIFGRKVEGAIVEGLTDYLHAEAAEAARRLGATG